MIHLSCEIGVLDPYKMSTLVDGQQKSAKKNTVLDPYKMSTLVDPLIEHEHVA